MNKQRCPEKKNQHVVRFPLKTKLIRVHLRSLDTSRTQCLELVGYGDIVSKQQNKIGLSVLVPLRRQREENSRVKDVPGPPALCEAEGLWKAH